MKIILSLIISLTCLALQGQNALHYQAVMRTPEGALLSDAELHFKFEIIAGGTITYSETHLVHTDAYGQLSLNIGQGELVTGQWNTIPWSTAFIELLIRCDFTGDGVYDLITTEVLQAVPFALSALHADTADVSADNKWAGDDAVYPADLEKPVVIGDSEGIAEFTIKGATVLRPGGATPMLIESDTVVIDVQHQTYIRLKNTTLDAIYAVILNAGIDIGQMIIVEAITENNAAIRCGDNADYSMLLAGDYLMQNGDTLMLIWNGTAWVELNRSINTD